MTRDALIILGLGGTGWRVLESLAVTGSFTNSSAGQEPHAICLCIDADLVTPAVSGVETLALSLSEREFAKLDPDWFPGGSIPHGVSNSRLLARMAFSSHRNKLRDRLWAFRRVAQVRTRNPRVVIIGSLAGGVGGGVLVPVATLCRETLGSEARISGFFLLPSVFPFGRSISQLHANAFQTLAELEELRERHRTNSPLDDICMISDETIGGAEDPFDWLANHVRREILQEGTYLYRALSEVIPPPVAKDIVVVNDELLAYLKVHPSLLYGLAPRKFEEVIAAILKGLGYDVVLTKQSRDGGKDLYAVHHSNLGQHLYIVECKRYAPDRPVGVDVVRSLYGVVQHERATMGIVATTSYFTKEACEFQRAVRYSLSLKDYDDLIGWLQEYFTPNRETKTA